MTNIECYDVGSIIVYRPFGGGERMVKVTAKESDVKNGESGFDGEIIDGAEDGREVWGYDSQILRVVNH
jgi:hypothetical protein